MHDQGADKNDIQLIRGIQSGDRELFAVFFQTHYAALCTFVLRYTGSHEASEDLVQDIFLSIWQNRLTWSPGAGVRPYLYKAARNKALDYLRHSKVKKDWETESQYLNDSDVDSPADKIHERETSKEIAGAIDDAIKQLPESRKMIFLLSREDGLTYQEIAEVLDVSVKTVETQMGRSIKSLREYLAEYLPLFLFF